jgi:hypothetical protein
MYFKQTAPHVLEERWWRNYQPGGNDVRLGVQVSEDREKRRLRVVSVTPDTPADGLLKEGDEIVGVNRLRFKTDRPVQEIRRGVLRRPHAGWVDLLVERNRMTIVCRLRIAFVDPVEVLRRVVALGQVVQRVVYFGDVPSEGGSRGYLTVELREGDKPAFDFPPLDLSQSKDGPSRP